MKIQILNLPSAGEPAFTVVFSEVDGEAFEWLKDSHPMVRDTMGARSILVVRGALEVVQ